VVGALLVGAARKAMSQKRGIKKIAGVVAGEWTAGAIGAVESWRESDDQEPPVPVAESRNRIVEIVRERRAIGSAELKQPRTKRAIARRLARCIPAFLFKVTVRLHHVWEEGDGS